MNTNIDNNLLKYIDCNNLALIDFFDNSDPIAIHSPTLNQSILLCTIFDKFGATWSNGTKYTDPALINAKYDTYKENWCFNNNHKATSLQGNWIKENHADIINVNKFINEVFLCAILREDNILLDLSQLKSMDNFLSVINKYNLYNYLGKKDFVDGLFLENRYNYFYKNFDAIDSIVAYEDIPTWHNKDSVKVFKIV